MPSKKVSCWLMCHWVLSLIIAYHIENELVLVLNMNRFQHPAEKWYKCMLMLTWNKWAQMVLVFKGNEFQYPAVKLFKCIFLHSVNKWAQTVNIFNLFESRPYSLTNLNVMICEMLNLSLIGRASMARINGLQRWSLLIWNKGNTDGNSRITSSQ